MQAHHPTRHRCARPGRCHPTISAGMRRRQYRKQRRHSSGAFLKAAERRWRQEWPNVLGRREREGKEFDEVSGRQQLLKRHILEWAQG